MSQLPSLLSESEALRVLNIPQTQKWRSFLRESLPVTESAGAFFYPRFDVELMAHKGGDFIAETSRFLDQAKNTDARAGRRGLQFRKH